MRGGTIFVTSHLLNVSHAVQVPLEELMPSAVGRVADVEGASTRPSTGHFRAHYGRVEAGF
jgi:hypothetical protein